MKPQPRPEQGQHWRNTKDGTVRRITDASDPWVVHFENVTTGYKTKVFRVSENGRPTGYVHVPKAPELQAKEDALSEEVHIRHAPGEGPRLTYCQKPVDSLISTTLANLRWWRKRERQICRACDRRRRDGTTKDLEQAA